MKKLELKKKIKLNKNITNKINYFLVVKTETFSEEAIHEKHFRKLNLNM